MSVAHLPSAVGENLSLIAFRNDELTLIFFFQKRNKKLYPRNGFSKVLFIAIYHFEAKVISRGTGRLVAAAAAYASCSQIYNDYDGVNHDYTRKKGCVYSEVFLTQNAPAEWQDLSLIHI